MEKKIILFIVLFVGFMAGCGNVINGTESPEGTSNIDVRVISNQYKEINITSYSVTYDGELTRFEQRDTTVPLVNNFDPSTRRSEAYTTIYSHIHKIQSFIMTLYLDDNRTYTIAGWPQSEYNLTGVDQFGVGYSGEYGISYSSLNPDRGYISLCLSIDINATGGITVSIDENRSF